MPAKPTRRHRRQSALISLAQAVRDKVLADVSEVIAEYEAELRRGEDDFSQFMERAPSPEPMPITQRKIGKLIVAACRDLAHLAIAHERRDPQGWAEAEIRALGTAIAKEYRVGFDLDKTLPAAIADGLHESRVLIVVAPAPPRAGRTPKKKTSSPATAAFQPSRDYRSIQWRGQHYTLTSNQAAIVERLHEEHIAGTPVVGKAGLLSTIQAETSRVRDSFKGSPLWRTLIVLGERRGTYKLDI